MLKSVLISIQPKWCELIASGKKTVEVRKPRPKLKTPFKVYIFITKSYDTLFGYGNPKKLCVDDVIEIRKLHRGGLSYSEIARKYDVTHQCISDICNYKRWKQVP